METQSFLVRASSFHWLTCQPRVVGFKVKKVLLTLKLQEHSSSLMSSEKFYFFVPIYTWRSAASLKIAAC